MKIVFICGALEPGRDGVGDYTRRLAANLVMQGIEVAILSINDQFILRVTHQNQLSDGIEIDTCRIPSKFKDKQRYKYANEYISAYNPNWLSLQYVPFSFNEKGLPFNLGKNLSKLTNGRNWHIMFHELWVGMEEKSVFKHVIWGKLQKILIRHLIKRIKPKLIHTQTKLYQIQLAKLGFKTQYLQLFSNIPVNQERSKIDTSNKITLVNFGTIHPTVPIESFAHEAALYEKKTGINVELILLGRCGNEQKKWIDIWQSEKLNIIILGEQSLEKISDTFSTSTFGITTTAMPLIEKSGSVAAMLEHNLPVICISNEWQPRGVTDVPRISGIAEYVFGNFESLITLNNLNMSYSGVRMVANQLKKDLFSALV